MAVKFELKEVFDSFQQLEEKLVSYITKNRNGYSKAHSHSSGLTDVEKKNLLYSTVEYKCWCCGEYIPNENGKRTRRQLKN